ncbi:hypothetical protein [Sphingobium sp. MI1205]|uniref:hypothetical protein n=1 Tax=Sphingobium sp. MI1205 TaxID=407020 RepID=UPI00077021A4|nr:hypothetical protein [Sphingobium sp. MI1205]AMK18925.1 outer membrane autotransporter barrel domain-containing protein [Sphingobium sp. MI1205]
MGVSGIQRQLSGRRTFASAGYWHASDGLAIAGISRSEALATVSAGASLKLTPAGALFFGAHREFGSESSGQSATVGYKLRF